MATAKKESSKTAKKAPAKKTAQKKSSAKKSSAEKVPAKKTAAKKAPATKTAAKKAPAKKTPAKKAPAKKASGSKYSPGASAKVGAGMKAMKEGKLRSSSGEKVTNPKQAIAIELSEARREGEQVPPNPNE